MCGSEPELAQAVHGAEPIPSDLEAQGVEPENLLQVNIG